MSSTCAGRPILVLHNFPVFSLLLSIMPDHVMGSWSFSKNTQKHVFCALSLNISYKIHFFFGEKILVALDTYAKKMNPPGFVRSHKKP